jgi:hypothetical protein
MQCEEAALNENAEHFGTFLFSPLWEFKNFSCRRTRARKAARQIEMSSQVKRASAVGGQSVTKLVATVTLEHLFPIPPNLILHICEISGRFRQT